MTKLSLTRLLVALGVAASLQGCVGIVVGGAVVGAFAASDRRTLGAQTEDREIQFKSGNRLGSVLGKTGHVNVSSFNRKVLLTGEVPDDAMKQEAERTVRNVEGVNVVVNELEVMGTSSFGSRSNDVLIESKVTASLVDAKDLYANAFKVVVERGNVYLMGRVTPREGDRGAQIASGVSGVARVIKVFEYITEDQLKQYESMPPEPKRTEGGN